MKFRLLVEFGTQAKEKFKKSKLSIFQPLQNWGEGVKTENSSPLDQTQPNFVYIFIQWAPGKLEMQKLTTQNGEGGQK